MKNEPLVPRGLVTALVDGDTDMDELLATIGDAEDDELDT